MAFQEFQHSTMAIIMHDDLKVHAYLDAAAVFCAAGFLALWLANGLLHHSVVNMLLQHKNVVK